MDELTMALMTKEDWEQVADWKTRDIPKDIEKEIQKDLLAYVEWGKAIIESVYNPDIEEPNLAEGKKLFTKMKAWKPEMFPKKNDNSR